MKKLLGLVLFGTVAASAMSGCYVSDRPAVYAQRGEWIPGHYAWNGYARVWVPGHWRR
jgi:hypothetical protein